MLSHYSLGNVHDSRVLPSRSDCCIPPAAGFRFRSFESPWLIESIPLIAPFSVNALKSRSIPELQALELQALELQAPELQSRDPQSSPDSYTAFPETISGVWRSSLSPDRPTRISR